ncbi:MAG: hypothetical protein ACJAUV_000097 [Flavobacteriales bacterium]|jgi:hypothetical protein
MKLLPLLLLPFILSGCSELDHKSNFTGNWWFCDSNQGGYAEISVTDSTTRYLSSELFNTFPLRIIEKNKNNISIESGFEITFLSENTALLINEYSRDTLNKIQENVKKFEDYECDMGISRAAYDKIIWHEFSIRSQKTKQKCSPAVLYKINNRPATVGTLDSSFFFFEKQKEVEVEFTYHYRMSNLQESTSKIDTTFITYNIDSSRVLIEYCDISACNDAFNMNADLERNGELYIHTNALNSGCSDTCTFNFYVLLEGFSGFEIKSINLNSKVISNDFLVIKTMN